MLYIVQRLKGEYCSTKVEGRMYVGNEAGEDPRREKKCHNRNTLSTMP